ncbi:Hypothetical predicted protein [Octopus vulgaris]|uniref:Uncharacterized protein n=1 Tax=Octopus vulgaris TaxID=6645 RepID=A0AA36AV48_OCTVU|nr:Hypothetical predicted protein [Octopus vulgaris]
MIQKKKPYNFIIHNLNLSLETFSPFGKILGDTKLGTKPLTLHKLMTTTFLSNHGNVQDISTDYVSVAVNVYHCSHWIL